VLVSHRCWDWYRQHPASACAQASTTRSPEVIRRQFLTWLDGYLVQHRWTDPRLARAVARERFLLEHPLAWTVLRHAMRMARRVGLG
jgi:hypothetical protein